MQDVSDNEKPVPLIVTVVPASEPSGGEPVEGLMVKNGVVDSVKTAVPKSPCTPVTLIVYPPAPAVPTVKDAEAILPLISMKQLGVVIMLLGVEEMVHVPASKFG